MSRSHTLPAPIQHSIQIPDNLSELDGSFTRYQRVEIAMDVIATLRSRQRKLVLGSSYFSPDSGLPSSGPLNSSVIRGKCYVCARGMFFIKSLDRYDALGLADFAFEDSVVDRTEDEWGEDQAELIEAAFEGGWRRDGHEKAREFFHMYGAYDDRKSVLIAICENIITNHGEFRP